jgi:hypothetical protein
VMLSAGMPPAIKASRTASARRIDKARLYSSDPDRSAWPVAEILTRSIPQRHRPALGR